MINIGQNVLDALKKSAYQGLKIEFEPLRGKPFHITSLDIVEGSFQIKMTSTSTNNMQIGNMSANDLSMELMNPTDAWGFGKFDDVYFCGATMRITLLVYDQTQDIMTETPFGVYIIDNQPRLLDTIKITAFSNVIRLDIPFDASELPSVMSLNSLVSEGLRRAGLRSDITINVFPILGGLNGSYKLEPAKIKSEQTITWRQVIKWCCECVGVNAISDGNGTIKFVSYEKYTPDVLRTENDENLETEDGEILLIDDTPNTDFQLTPSLRYADNSSEVAEEDVVITGFQFKIDDKLYPDNAVMDYGLQSENNLVFYALRPAGKVKQANYVNEKLAGFTYRPFKCNTLSFPHLQTFDSVVYIKDGKQYHSIITDIVYKLNGDMTLTAKGKNKEQKAFEVLGALTPKQQAIIDSVSRKVDNTREQLSSYENALLLFNEKMLRSMGLYKTVETDANGGMIVYFHDKATLSESRAIYMFGAAGFAWTTDGWKDGSPVWHYGFTDTGDAIFNEVQAYKISADLIQAGVLQSQNGASWISLDDGTFSFRSAIQTGVDGNNNPTYSYEDRLKLDNTGELGVYGTLRSSQYPYYSVSIGKSETGGRGALTATYQADGYGEIFQVYPVATSSEKGTVWTAPFLLNSAKTNRKGISVFPSEITMFNDNYGNQTHVSCKEGAVDITNSTVNLQLYRDNIMLTSYENPWVYFNYFPPEKGIAPQVYGFGNGTPGERAGIECGAIDSIGEVKCTSVNCSGQIIGENATLNGSVQINSYLNVASNISTSAKLAVGKNAFYDVALSVFGDAMANNWYVVSDPNLKENIIEQVNTNALKKLCDMKFYSYDFKNTSVHVKFGAMANEVPAEIVTEDGKAIDLYSYIGLTAKGVQELNAKFEAQEKKIKTLESRVEQLEALIADLNSEK